MTCLTGFNSYRLHIDLTFFSYPLQTAKVKPIHRLVTFRALDDPVTGVHMIRVCTFVLVLICCMPCLEAGAATAKQGDLSSASANWFYGYYGQLGSRGFFGDYNADASLTGDFAPLNSWVGNGTDIKQLVTGTNAAISAVSLDLKPQYGNEWVILKARYTITPYVTSSSEGAVTTISPQNLAEWMVQVNTPVAHVTMGKKVFQKGFDLQFSNNRTAEYILLEQSCRAPDILGCLVAAGFLPRRVLSWFNPDRWPRYKTPEDKTTGKMEDNPDYQFFGGDPDTNKDCFRVREDAQKEDPDFQDTAVDTPDEAARKAKWPSDDDAYAWGHAGPGSLRIGLGFFPWETPIIPSIPPGTTNLGPPYFNLWNPSDIGANQAQNYLAFIQYTSTDLEFGVGCLRSTYHQGPELQPSSTARLSAPTFERYITEGWSYLKYSNGRYFFNTELDWFNRVHRFQRSLDGTFFGTPQIADGRGSVFAPRYWESWRYMAEAGGVFGPFGARFFYCFMPGPDRRHGVYIDRQPFIQENRQQAFGLFDPYSILLSYRFGSGVNAPGHISDASVYAVKLDYALAANLIVQGSVLRAFRNSHGYAVGFIRPTNATYGYVSYGEPPNSDPGNLNSLAPSIPESDLGWEVMAGFNWELLEGWSLSVRASYWRPGKWFNCACVDKSVPDWTNPRPSNNWGIRPDRVIDSFLAFEIQVGATY